MNDSQQAASNPYAPTALVTHLALPGVEGIPLREKVHFAGALTRSDLNKMLSPDLRSVIAWILIGASVSMLVNGYLLETMGSRGALAVSLVIMGTVLFGIYYFSGRVRASRYLRRHPRSLERQSGWIAENDIHLDSELGWTDITWEVVVGISVKRNYVILATNPYHSPLLFLRRDFFSPEDWQAFTIAIAALAPRLPLVRNAYLARDVKRNSEGTPGILDRFPEDAILLDGALKNKDLLGTPAFYRGIYLTLIKFLVVLVVVISTMWLFGAAMFAWVWIGPCLLSIWFLWKCWIYYQAFFRAGDSSLLRLTAAVSDEGIRYVTPRASTFFSWDMFSDIYVDDKIVMLRESLASFTFFVLPRSALVDPAQWESLSKLCKLRITSE